MGNRSQPNLRKMLAAASPMMLSTGLVGGVAPMRAVRAQVQMADISAFDNIWGMEAKMAVYEQWDPEKPRDYNNFNPFERNDESAQFDTNGCFPGQSKGYKSPLRPDQSWAIMQEERAKMDELATNKVQHEGQARQLQPQVAG